MKIFVAGGTGAIGRPLIAELLAKGHALVALTRSPEKAQALVQQGIEPAIADVFHTDAVKAVVSRAQPHSMRFLVGDCQMKIRPWHLMPRLRLQQVPAR